MTDKPFIKVLRSEETDHGAFYVDLRVADADAAKIYDGRGVVIFPASYAASSDAEDLKREAVELTTEIIGNRNPMSAIGSHYNVSAHTFDWTLGRVGPTVDRHYDIKVRIDIFAI
jgi:hypothetical protein